VLERLLRGLGGNPPAPASIRKARATIALCQALLSERGEVSGARLASEVLAAYRSLDAEALEAFFDLLVDEFSPDRQRLFRAADQFRQDPSPTHLVQLQLAAESPRQELFRRCNLGPGGTGVLLDFRRRLLSTLKIHPERTGIDADLVHLFRSWFNRGFLVLQRIDWRTSALTLERIINYEAVHQIQGWADLRRRLEADRRCYAFFHPALPDEPLIFIEVALTKGMSGRVQPLLDAKAPVADPLQTDCAIFYSITNCQEGLRGVSFGNFLIKQVVEDLGREFPKLRTFATLSPLPGFQQWLHSEGRERMSPPLAALVDAGDLRASLAALSESSPLKTELLRLATWYLLKAKRAAAPLDPVARFHLANGASLERLNWMGDASDAGIQRSLGLMVNYVYRLDAVEENHEAYAKDHRIIASRAFERMLRRVRP
jgi:malonyl-CoA decarboxylase